MSHLQIWVRYNFHDDFREDSKVYLIESLLDGPHDDGPPALHAEDVVDGHQQRRLRVPRRHLNVGVLECNSIDILGYPNMSRIMFIVF